jgi:hypothetical protein
MFAPALLTGGHGSLLARLAVALRAFDEGKVVRSTAGMVHRVIRQISLAGPKAARP